MSDALEKVSGLTHLPIFPLPLILLPSELLPLHIFEERYRQMLRDIERHGNCFGIVHFEAEESIVARPAIGTAGCVAEVRESELLHDGRSNVLTLGIIRFRLVDYSDTGKPYHVARVEYFEDSDENPAALEKLADAVFELFERIAKAAFKLSGNRGTLPEIQRATPEALSFLITAAFNFENEKKYELLEMTSTTERLTELKGILVKTVGQMEESADIRAVARTNGHSKKPIDL